MEIVNNVNANIINYMERQIIDIQNRKAGAIASAQAEYYKNTTSKEIAILEETRNKVLAEITAKYNSDVATLNAEHDKDVAEVKARDNQVVANKIGVEYDNQVATIRQAIDVLRG